MTIEDKIRIIKATPTSAFCLALESQIQEMHRGICEIFELADVGSTIERKASEVVDVSRRILFTTSQFKSLDTETYDREPLEQLERQIHEIINQARREWSLAPVGTLQEKTAGIAKDHAINALQTLQKIKRHLTPTQSISPASNFPSDEELSVKETELSARSYTTAADDLRDFARWILQNYSVNATPKVEINEDEMERNALEIEAKIKELNGRSTSHRQDRIDLGKWAVRRFNSERTHPLFHQNIIIYKKSALTKIRAMIATVWGEHARTDADTFALVPIVNEINKLLDEETFNVSINHSMWTEEPFFPAFRRYQKDWCDSERAALINLYKRAKENQGDWEEAGK
jgi:hypothetical protein